METNKVRAVEMPDGSYIRVDDCGNFIDASVINKDGREDLLVSIDYDKDKGLRVLVYDSEHEEPIYTHKVDTTRK